MIIIFLMTIAILDIADSTNFTRDYCSIACDAKTVGSHTMCKYPEGPAKSCNNYKRYKFTAKNIEDILIEHNAIRQDFGRVLGKESKHI